MEKFLLVLIFFITNSIIYTNIIKNRRNKTIAILLVLFAVIIIPKLLVKEENFNVDSEMDENMGNQPYTKLNYTIKLKNKDSLAQIYNIDKFVKMPNDLGNAIKFNNEKSYMIVSDINLEVFSISFVMKALDSSKKQVIMASIDNSMKLILNKNKLSLTVTNSVEALHTKGIITDNEWHHIAIVKRKNEFRLFINGNFSNIKYTRLFKLPSLIFGCDKNKKYSFGGYIGEINIYDNAVLKSFVCNLHDMCRKPIELSDIKKPKTSCALPECDYVPKGNTKEDCLNDCVDSSGCGPTKCKEKCDSCDDDKLCGWIKPPVLVAPKCDYVPYGSTKLSCINKCILNDNCDYMACQETCNSCSDTKLCPWIDPPPEPPKKLPIEPPPVYDSKGRPTAPQIMIKPANAMVKIQWSRPYEGDAPVEAYVAFLFKTFNKGEGVKMSMVPFPRCESCVHVINDLDEETTYSVGIRAYNNLGLSRMSNIMTFQPKFKLNPKPVPPPSNDEPEITYNICNNSQN